MEFQSESYELLMRKLDEFIRKYYKNRLLKGLIYVVAGLSIAFLLVTTLEYFGQFDTAVRTILAWTFIGFSAFILVKYFIYPLAQLYKLGKVLTHEQASLIIGKHFPEIEDKLINTLQLKSLAGSSGNLLIEASIDQKIGELSPVPFTNAVNFKSNLKYLKYALIPVVALGFIMIKAPGMIRDSSERLVNYNTFYEKVAPFKFEIQNSNLEVVQNEDFNLELKLTGSEIPKEVFINVNGNRFRMEKTSTISFSYNFRNLQKNQEFRFFADEFYSGEFLLKVIPKPLLVNFEVKLDYPGYLNKKSETLSNTGDLSVPAGTKVQWKFFTKDVDFLRLGFRDTFFHASKRENNEFEFSRNFLRSDFYTIKPSNNQLNSSDSILYNISVIPDGFPVIEVEQRNDTLSSKILYFIGSISDDYGFSRMAFNYRFTGSKDKSKTGTGKNVPIAIPKGLVEQTFYHFWDLNSLNIEPSDELEYYFEVWDNDGVNGSKSSRSKTLTFKAPSLQEISANAEKNNQELKKEMNNVLKEVSQIDKEIQKLREKLVDKKSLSWEDKKQIQDLLNKHKDLQKSIDQIKHQNERNNIQQQEFKKMDPEILEKQEEIQKLMNEVMTDEIKDLFKKLQDLLKQNNKEEIQKQLENFELNDKELKKQMDRMLELFKELEVEKKINEAIEGLEKLAREQEKLSEKTQEKNANQEELKEKQKELNKEFENLQKELKDIEQKNKELENPKDLDNTDKEQKEISEEMKESQENLNQNKNKKSSQNQKNAAQKMQDLANKMEQMMKDSEAKDNEEDYNKLREILENLVQVSFTQEDIMQELRVTPGYNPKFIALTQKQRKLKDDAKMIEDSLLALSKRVVQIKSFINKEIGLVNSNMDKAISELGKRNIMEAMNRQQYVMTSVNNLAVMLSESLKNMQEQMKKQSMGQCKKPGKSKPNMSMMKELQEQLNKQIQEMKDGKTPGGKQGKPTSEEFSRMAAQQEAIRRQMQKLQEELKKEGSGGKLGDLQKTQDLMEKTEKDLVNKLLNPETIKRQQEILTRMLDHEKAQKEQETDHKRESKEGDNMQRPMPPSLEDYIRQKNKEQELLKTLPPNLKLYYKNKVRDYFKEIGQ